MTPRTPPLALYLKADEALLRGIPAKIAALSVKST